MWYCIASCRVLSRLVAFSDPFLVQFPNVKWFSRFVCFGAFFEAFLGVFGRFEAFCEVLRSC